ncbi:hypothetical protein HOH87_00035 [bacterium]|nr:hypothetical protein [bacterium]
MKSRLLPLFLAIILSGSPAFAASDMVLKSIDSIFPVPISLLVNLGTSIGWGAQSIQVNASDALGLRSKNLVFTTNMALMLKTSPTTSTGIAISMGESQSILETGTDTFNTNTTKVNTWHLVTERQLFKERNFTISGTLGLGMTSADYTILTHNEGSGGSDQTIYRHGSTFSYQVGLSSRYYLNPKWAFGLSAGYIGAPIDTVSNRAGNTTTDPGIDASGSTLNFFTSFKL